MKVEPKFCKGDYIISRDGSGDIAIVKGVTKKNYYQFEAYYDNMLDELKDVKDKSYDLQVNYQKFWDSCTIEEKKQLDEILKEKGGN